MAAHLESSAGAGSGCGTMRRPQVFGPHAPGLLFAVGSVSGQQLKWLPLELAIESRYQYFDRASPAYNV